MRSAIVVLSMFGTLHAQDPLTDALAALRTSPPSQRDAAVKAVLLEQPDPAEVVSRLRRGVPVKPLGPGWHVLAARERPFHLYIPPGVRAADKPVPLLLHLHGGVARPDYPAAVSRYGTHWTPSADAEGFVMAFPMARQDCMWWTDAGLTHVRAVIREAKRLAPIDDDAIVTTGFSDGASGCYFFAMAAPDPFAAHLPLNGHPAVAASASGRQLYLRNLTMTPLFVAMTQDDQLYPAKSVLEHLRLAIGEEAPVRMVSYESGGHRPVYFEDQRAAFARFVVDTPRDPLPTEIDWWCAAVATGRVRWLEVVEIGSAPDDADALPDLNVMSTPGRVRLGVNVDRAFQGPGVAISQVTKDSVAARLDLKVGDVIRGMDGKEIANLDGLVAALQAKGYGDALRIQVERDGQTIAKEGSFPAFITRPYYQRGRPTARVSVRVEGQTIRIRSRNVRRLRLWLSPDLFGAQPVTIEANGRRVAATVTAVSLPDLLRRYAEEADGGRLFTRFAEVALIEE